MNQYVIIISFYKGGVKDKEIYKEVYQKSSYCRDIPSNTNLPPLHFFPIPEHLEFT